MTSTILRAHTKLRKMYRGWYKPLDLRDNGHHKEALIPAVIFRMFKNPNVPEEEKKI